MQSLAPIEPHEPPTGGRTAAAGDRGAGARAPWSAVAIAVGVAVGCAVLLDWRELTESLSRHTLLQAELALCVGAIPGFLLTRLNRRDTPRRATALDDLVARGMLIPVPPAAGYTHYLPCSLLARDATTQRWTSESSGTGQRRERPEVTAGVLYAGPAGIRFQPRNAQAPLESDVESGFEIGPVRMVSATPVALVQRMVARLTQRLPPYALLVRWPAGQALFAVPSIGDTLPRLHKCLDTLRWDNPTPGPDPLRGNASAV